MAEPEPSQQPELELLDLAEPARSVPVTGDVPATLVRSRWCARQRSDLPDARRWSLALAQALVETLHAFRPVNQLNRWVDEEVMDALALHVRRRRSATALAQPRLATPPVIRSLRIQHPDADVAEVSVHLGTARRSGAIAFRLEATGQRWLCTAIELGPRRGEGRPSG